MRRLKSPKQKLRTSRDHGTVSTRSSVQVTRAKCMCGYNTRISWWWPWCVVIVTAVIRIRYEMLPENWWILHPDEVFQSMEVAFSEVYGYGFRPYEFLPAPNDTSIPADAQMLKSGMYGLRSPVYPRMFTIVLHAAKALGLDNSPFMVCRVFNAAITSLLPLTIYWFVLKVFHCRLLAFLTCALCAVEHHLAVFGTHTIVNSFISPAIFLGLTLCLKKSENSQKGKEEHQELTEKHSDLNDNVISKSVTENNQNKIKELHRSNSNKNGIHPTEKLYDLSNHANNFDGVCREEMLGVNTATRNTDCIKPVLGGFLVGVVCYIRPDTAFFCVCLLCLLISSKRQLNLKHMKELIQPLLGAAAAFAICAADDWIWYGGVVISPVQWFIFNLLSGKSSTLFGMEDTDMYLKVLFGNKNNLLIILCTIGTLFYSRLKQKDTLLLPRECCAISISFMINIIVYSSAGHKESRFIHNAIVLYVLICSYGFHTLISVLRKQFQKGIHSSLILASFLMMFTLLSYNQVPSIETSSISEWTYGNARDSADVNACLDWLRQRNDVTGVHIDASLYDTAGFTILKHDVPLLVKMHNEFYLFDGERGSRRHNKYGRIRVIRNYSDFIHESNKVYLNKVLSRNTVFNYAIVKSDVYSLVNSKYSYKKVFTQGQYKVFYRNFSFSKDQELQKLSETLPVGNNATVLEYEANWLITNALYRLAIERTEMAIQIDSSRVRLYQQMFVCYSKLNNLKMLNYYKDECFRRFGKDVCLTHQEKIVLHEHYNRFDQRP